jgi:hypothetical protein
MKYGWILWIGWGVSGAFANPFFKVTSPVWEENTKILVGNCSVQTSDIGEVFLQSPEKNGALLLDVVQDFATPYFYSLWANGSENAILLMQRRDEAKPWVEESLALPLVAKRGTLTLVRVMLSQQWHTLLLLTVTEKTGQKSLLQVFDVTYPTRGLRRFLAYDSSQIGVISTRPIVVRLPSQATGVLFASAMLGVPYLQFIDFAAPKTVRSISLDSNLPERLSAIDSGQCGIADKLYLSDGTALSIATWGEKEETVVTRLLVKARLIEAPLVVRDPKGWGHHLYVVGEIMGKRGVFLIEAPVEKVSEMPRVQLLEEGEFLALFVRYGQLWVIPRAVSDAPFVLKMPLHQRVKLVASPQYISPARVRLQAVLLWDSLVKQERLIFLNDSCQLNTILFEPYLGSNRSGWRKASLNDEI